MTIDTLTQKKLTELVCGKEENWDYTLKPERMSLDLIIQQGWEIAFSVIPTNKEPVTYALWERDPTYKIRRSGMVRLQKGEKIPKTIQVSYLKGQIVEESPVIGLVERVPQHITVLGAREIPKIELLAALTGTCYGGCEIEGSGWKSIQEMLADIYPLSEMEYWKNVENFPSSELKYIEKKIAERYEIAGIDFGFRPTIEEVYNPVKSLPNELKEILVKAYGEISSSKAVI